MPANVSHGVDDTRLDEIVRPRAGFGEAIIGVTLTTICGTDLHIVRGEYLAKLIPNSNAVPQQPFRLGFGKPETKRTPRRPLEEVLL